MSIRQYKKVKQIRVGSRRKLLGMLVFVLLFGSIGVSLVLLTHAASGVTLQVSDGGTVGDGANTYDSEGHVTKWSETTHFVILLKGVPAGATSSPITWTASGANTDSGSSSVRPGIDNIANAYVHYLVASCSGAVTVSASVTVDGTSYSSSASVTSCASTTCELTPANCTPGPGPGPGPGPSDPGPGNSDPGPGPSGPGPGPGPGNNGNTPNGSGGTSTPSKTGNTAKNTSNTKAAGGSTKQTDKKGSAPSSTSQGGKQTPNKIDPSPFYDGKQYQPGSARDKGIKGVFNKAGRNIVKLLPYIAGILLVTSLGIWWWVRRRHQNSGGYPQR